ncbi:MAG: lysylphosphatidylglycerol synthase domain-containing protein, partial [Candidatus Latescibacterota bacterium]
ALLLASFSKSVTRPLRALAGRLLPARPLAWLEEVRQGIYQYRTRRATLAGVALLALLVELTLIACLAVTVYGISGTLPFALFLLFIPLIEIVVLAVPITPDGLGLREGLMAAVLAQAGLTGEQTGVYVALALLGRVLKGLGGLPFLLVRRTA